MIKNQIYLIYRLGLKRIIQKPFNLFLANSIIKNKTGKSFLFNNNQYPFFYHKYNSTWTNERCVEVPIIKSIINNSKGKILEIGNVLAHYYTPTWDILDKYEKGKGVINKDIETFSPNEKYDLIVAISTFEHIGFDYEKNKKDSARKIISAFDNIKNNCLKKHGKIIITTPIGWNPAMDKISFSNKLGFDNIYFLKRKSKYKWIQVNQSEAEKSIFNKPFPYANCIFIGEYNNK